MRWLVFALVAACGGTAATELQLASSEPPYGPLVGGTRITLTGAGFTPEASYRLFVAGREAPLVAHVDESTLEVVIPAGDRSGDAELVLLDASRSTIATGIFRYSTAPTITSVDPPDVLSSSTTTTMTVTGSGFVDEGAGTVSVVVNGVLATDAVVANDGLLTFTVPPGDALAEPDVQVIDTRGAAMLPRAFRYIPSTRSGLLLFRKFGAPFAVFFDPVDNSTVEIPGTALRLRAAVRDEAGDYWGFDRNNLYGRIDLAKRQMIDPRATGAFSAMIRIAGENFAIERGMFRFAKVDLDDGSFTLVGTESVLCCGGFGLASDGVTVYFTSRVAGASTINTIDPVTGTTGTPVPLATPGFRVEEMRYFGGTLYAAGRDGTLVTIDPATGTVTQVPLPFGQFNAMEVFEPSR
jgi:hypothetical protein